MALFRLEILMAEAQEEHKDCSFPEYIRLMRETLGMRKSTASTILGQPAHRLNVWECGNFCKRLTHGEIRGLSELYGLDYNTLRTKCDEFLTMKGAKDMRQIYG